VTQKERQLLEKLIHVKRKGNAMIDENDEISENSLSVINSPSPMQSMDKFD
jgi:hypothetical protein